MIRLLHICWLVAVWVVLWSDVTVANLLSGVVVALAVTMVTDTTRDGELLFRPLRAAHFALYFAYKLVEASVIVTLTVIAPANRTRAGIVAVPLTSCPDALVTLIADTISLTPGTLTLEVRRDPLVLYVHVLHVHDVEQVRRDVRKLEVLAVRAFGNREALATLTVDDSTSWEARP